MHYLVSESPLHICVIFKVAQPLNADDEVKLTVYENASIKKRKINKAL